jgi:predicted dinucleotide-binding enzyme
LFSSRNPDQLGELVAQANGRARAVFVQEAAAMGDIIVLAVPYGAVPQVARDFGHLLTGKVVIDVGNPNEERDGAMANDARANGVGLTTARYLPGARVVRAFSAVGSGTVSGEAHQAERIGIPVAGDDAEAVEIVARLVSDAGFEPVVVGNLEQSRVFDVGTPGYRARGTARVVREGLGLPPQ